MPKLSTKVDVAAQATGTDAKVPANATSASALWRNDAGSSVSDVTALVLVIAKKGTPNSSAKVKTPTMGPAMIPNPQQHQPCGVPEARPTIAEPKSDNAMTSSKRVNCLSRPTEGFYDTASLRSKK